MSDQSVPPFVLTCHLTVGVGDPDAAAVKVAVEPGATEALVGSVVTNGLGSVNVTEVEV